MKIKDFIKKDIDVDVYDNVTQEVIDISFVGPLELTEEGKRNYQKFLEDRADEIIYKSEHPFKYFFRKLLDFFA